MKQNSNTLTFILSLSHHFTRFTNSHRSSDSAIKSLIVFCDHLLVSITVTGCVMVKPLSPQTFVRVSWTEITLYNILVSIKCGNKGNFAFHSTKIGSHHELLMHLQSSFKCVQTILREQFFHLSNCKSNDLSFYVECFLWFEIFQEFTHIAKLYRHPHQSLVCCFIIERSTKSTGFSTEEL